MSRRRVVQPIAPRARRAAFVPPFLRAGRRILRRSAKRALRALPPAPFPLQLIAAGLVVLAVLAAANWAYQAVRKPSEMFFPVSGALSKLPSETWREYGWLFRMNSTAIMTPELLAALAQVEGAGNPVARTYWRWRFTWNPFEMYRPASSAVGMYQITDATFREAKRYCVRNHSVAEDGPWYDWRSCWFNALYTRVVPNHAVEMISALLDRKVAGTLGRLQIANATLQQQQDLAAVIHLCGAGAGEAYARRGFRHAPRQQCGDHDIGAYLAHLNSMKQQFARIAAAG
ncbi:MAG TPA: hypothetical protein VEF92_02955 [Burkholderiales bacterium]|nr:hypothetical protein [Burkholderiales bacterium]